MKLRDDNGLRWLGWSVSWTVVAIVITLLFVGVVGTAYYAVQAGWINMQTHIIHQTNQYTTTAVTAMENDRRDYDRLQIQIDQDSGNAVLINDLQCQQQSDVSDAWQQADKIDHSLIPSTVLSWLDSHDAASMPCH